MSRHTLRNGVSVIYCEPTGELVTDYQHYLRTMHWHALRRAKQYGGICEACGHDITGDWEVHHRHYNSIGNESLDDLMLLHPLCHRMIHDKVEDGARLQSSAPVGTLCRRILGAIA